MRPRPRSEPPARFAYDPRDPCPSLGAQFQAPAALILLLLLLLRPFLLLRHLFHCTSVRVQQTARWPLRCRAAAGQGHSGAAGPVVAGRAGQPSAWTSAWTGPSWILPCVQPSAVRLRVQADVLTFETPPLEQPLELVGPVPPPASSLVGEHIRRCPRPAIVAPVRAVTAQPWGRPGARRTGAGGAPRRVERARHRLHRRPLRRAARWHRRRAL